MILRPRIGLGSFRAARNRWKKTTPSGIATHGDHLKGVKNAQYIASNANNIQSASSAVRKEKKNMRFTYCGRYYKYRHTRESLTRNMCRSEILFFILTTKTSHISHTVSNTIFFLPPTHRVCVRVIYEFIADISC